MLEAATNSNHTYHPKHRQYRPQITNRKTNEKGRGNEKNPTSKYTHDDDDVDPEHDRSKITSASVLHDSTNASNRATIDTVIISSSNFPATPDDSYPPSNNCEDRAMKVEAIVQKKSVDDDNDVIQEGDHMDDHSSPRNLDFSTFDPYSCRIDLFMERRFAI